VLFYFGTHTSSLDLKSQRCPSQSLIVTITGYNPNSYPESNYHRYICLTDFLWTTGWHQI